MEVVQVMEGLVAVVVELEVKDTGLVVEVVLAHRGAAQPCKA